MNTIATCPVASNIRFDHAQPCANVCCGTRELFEPKAVGFASFLVYYVINRMCLFHKLGAEVINLCSNIRLRLEQVDESEIA